MKQLFKWLLKKPAPARHVSADPLDTPLLHFSDNPLDVWTARSAMQGTSILGSTGSGKSSASGRLLAHAFLRSGAGGLVLTCKPDERMVWERYCAETNRSDDLVVFSPSNPWRFNFMQYEFARAGVGSHITENLVRVFAMLADVLERKGQASGPDYWSRAMNQLVRNAVQLAAIARGTPTLDLIAQIIATAAVDLEQAESSSWKESSICAACIREGDSAEKNELDQADWPHVVRFWQIEYPSLSPRTRSCVSSMFTTLAEQFLRGEIRRLFCSTMNIDPEVTFNEHKVLVIDLPVKEFAEIGVLSQVLWKFIWQRAVERRDIDSNPAPCFVWADEAQHFITKYDATFQMTSRSARAMTVYLSQSLPNYLAVMTRHETDSLMANLATKIWHRNSCSVTNAAAADTIARQRQFRFTTGTSVTEGGSGEERVSRNVGGGDTIEHQFLPGDFQFLRSGGPANERLVDAIVYENGRIWSSGKNYLRVTFCQSDVP